MARETLEQKAMRIAQETGLDYENVLQGMQMGDIDFQMAVAPYMGYKGEIDPSIARYHALPKGVRSSLKGFSIPSTSKTPYINVGSFAKARGDSFLLPAEAGTVNAIDDGATPATWAHEYAHQYRKDKALLDKAFPESGEYDMDAYFAFTKFGRKNAPEINARVLDIRNAQNINELLDPVQYIANAEIKHLENEIDKAFSTDNVKEARKLNKKSNYIRENIINNPTQKNIKDYINTNLKDLNVEYDKLGTSKSNLFKSIVTNNDKEERAKTAKTFKESLD